MPSFNASWSATCLSGTGRPGLDRRFSRNGTDDARRASRRVVVYTARLRAWGLSVAPGTMHHMTEPAAPRPLDPAALRVPTTTAERDLLRDLLWEALPKPLTLRMARHTMVFRADASGRAVSTGAHAWGPLQVELELGPSGTVTIAAGSNTLTGRTLDGKALLDLADTVQDALAADPTVGPLVAAMRAVAHQRLQGHGDVASEEGLEWRDDAEVTASALARLGDVLAAGEAHDELAALRSALAEARGERDDARAWARAVFHGMGDAPYVPANYPQWLTDPA